MSIATQIARLQGNRNTIRTQLMTWGVATDTDTLATLATTISGIPKRTASGTLSISTPSITLSSGYYDGGSISLIPETKTATPAVTAQTITPTAGKVLSSVTVQEIPNQKDAGDYILDISHTSKTIAAGYYTAANTVSIDVVSPTFSATTATTAGTDTHTPDTGKVYGTVTINRVVTETKTATLKEVSGTTISDDITPTSGKLLSSVTVPRIKTETRTETAGTTAVTFNPSAADKYIKQITVNPTPTEAGSASEWYYIDGTTTEDTYSPSTGKFFSSFTVPRVDPKYQDISGVTASAAQVLTGYKFVASNGTLTDGSMPNNAGLGGVISIATPSYTIPAGYTTGGTVTISPQTLTFTPTVAGATLTPETGKVISSVTVAPIPNQQTALDVTLDATHNGSGDYTNTSVTIPAGYYTAAGSVDIDIEEPTLSAVQSTTAGTDAHYPSEGKVFGKVLINKTLIQTKSATLKNVSGTTVEDTISPDSGYLLSSVTVPRVPIETKEVTAGTSSKSVTPTSGKYLTQVTVLPTPTETKTVDPVWVSGTTTYDDYTPTSGKYLSSFRVNRVPTKYKDVSGVTATAAQVLTGYKFVTDTDGLIDGTMPNRGAVSQVLDTTTTSYTVPAGYHNGEGTVSIVLQTESASPSDSGSTVTPEAGKVLSSVTVTPITYSAAPTVTLAWGTLTASTPKGRYNAGSGNVTISKTGMDGKAEHVLAGKKVIGLNADGTAVASITGTMINNGAGTTYTLDTTKVSGNYTNASKTIAAGYWSSANTVSIDPQTKSFTPTTAGGTVTADEGRVLEAVTIAAIPNQKTAISHTLDATKTSGSYSNTSKTIPAGYYTAAGTVNISIQDKTITPTTATSAGTDVYNPDSGKVFGQITVNKVVTETKTATLAEVSGETVSDTITPTSGKLLSAVTVPRIKTETRTATAGTSAITVNPTASDKYIKQITINPTPTEAGTANTWNYVNGETTTDTYTPTEGKYFSSFTVPRVPTKYQDVSGVTATAGQVLSGAKYVAANGTLTTGTMPNQGAKTYTLDVTKSEGTYLKKTYTIPAGYHNGEGVISIVPETVAKDPADSAVIVTPTAGKVLEQVTINAISYSAAPSISLAWGSLTASTNKGRYNAGSSNITFSKTGLTGKAAHVLSGYQVVGLNADGTAAASITGTMTNNGNGTTYTLDVTKTSGSYSNASKTIAAGYWATANTISINPQTKSFTPDTTGKTITADEGRVLEAVTIAAIPVSTLTASAIAGQAILEATNDYAWKTTVTVPAGYYNQTVLEKTFSDIFPSLSTDAATASEMLLGYKAYNSAGQVITGTMPNNGAGTTTTLTASNKTKTVAAGYWSSANTVQIQTQTKEFTPTVNGGTVTPDANYVLESVTIAAIPNQQSKITHTLDATKVSGSYTNTSKTIPAGYYTQAGTVSISIQDKTITPTTATSAGTDVYTPDTGKVFGTITVNKVVTETKAATLAEVDGSTVSDTITPTSGKLLSSVTVPRIPIETRTGTASPDSVVTVTPSATGKYMTSVTINQISAGALSAGAGSVSATGKNNLTLGTAVSSTSGLTGYYFQVDGSGTVGVGTAGWLKTTASKSSNTATLYYPIATATLTTNATLPSGGSATGVGYNKYIKIAAGYYHTDRYISSGVSAGSATTPASTITVTPSLSFNTSTRLVTVTGTKTESITPSVSAGYVAAGTAGNVTATINSTGNTYEIPAGAYSASGSASAGSAQLSVSGFQTTNTNTGYSITVSTTAGSVTPTATIGTAGYIAAGSKNGTAVSVAVNGATTVYIPTDTFTFTLADGTAQTLTIPKMTAPAIS